MQQGPVVVWEVQARVVEQRGRRSMTSVAYKVADAVLALYLDDST